MSDTERLAQYPPPQSERKPNKKVGAGRLRRKRRTRDPSWLGNCELDAVIEDAPFAVELEEIGSALTNRRRARGASD